MGQFSSKAANRSRISQNETRTRVAGTGTGLGRAGRRDLMSLLGTSPPENLPPSDSMKSRPSDTDSNFDPSTDFQEVMEAWPLQPSSAVRSMIGKCSSTAVTANQNIGDCDNLEAPVSKTDTEEIIHTLEEDPFLALPDEMLAYIMTKCEPGAFLAAWQASRRWRAVARQEAASIFNAKPRQGIAFLVNAGFFSSADDVARFLLTGKNLKPQLIGQYLGDRTPRCYRVLQAYLHLFDFTGLDIEDALWAFLTGFQLPELAHQTRRVIAGFGARYVECNQGCEYGAGVGISPLTAEDLAMCLLELRAAHPVLLGGLGFSANALKASRERFLNWAFVPLPRHVLEQIHDRTMTKLSKGPGLGTLAGA